MVARRAFIVHRIALEQPYYSLLIGSTNASNQLHWHFKSKNASMSTFLLHDITNLIHRIILALLLSIRFQLMTSLHSMPKMQQKLTLNPNCKCLYTIHLTQFISYGNIVPAVRTRWSPSFFNL